MKLRAERKKMRPTKSSPKHITKTTQLTEGKKVKNLVLAMAPMLTHSEKMMAYKGLRKSRQTKSQVSMSVMTMNEPAKVPNMVRTPSHERWKSLSEGPAFINMLHSGKRSTPTSRQKQETPSFAKRVEMRFTQENVEKGEEEVEESPKQRLETIKSVMWEQHEEVKFDRITESNDGLGTSQKKGGQIVNKSVVSINDGELEIIADKSPSKFRVNSLEAISEYDDNEKKYSKQAEPFQGDVSSISYKPYDKSTSVVVPFPLQPCLLCQQQLGQCV
eukprot:TRINITY_DN310_c0_g7_i1.p3 TRINITY_DN310_c0_g7~~TRINITY_DN310_c0_g7_i1.p3  ORF type:complete len:274 (+),score=14.11 TRINITY_DN310_c0_g7_i1:2688-3509(+)